MPTLLLMKKTCQNNEVHFYKVSSPGFKGAAAITLQIIKKKNIVGSAFGGEGNSTQYHRHSFRNESYEMADCQ